MTQRDRFIKWFVYALGVLPVWVLEAMVLNRLPVWGVIPVLLPLAGVAVALWEGPVAGGVFGLALGLLCDAVYPGAPGGMTFGLTVLAVFTGLVCRYRVRRNFLGYLLCASVSMVLIDLVRVLWGTLSGLGSLRVLAPVALREVLWSLCFTLPIYGLFKLIHSRVGGDDL